MDIVLIKMAVRFVVFVAVFWLAVRRFEKVSVEPKWAIPVVGVVFALLNVGLYWLLKPILNIATVGFFGFALPFLLNALFLYLTVWLVGHLRTKFSIEGTMTMIKMCVVVTIAHGVLWLILDVIST